MGLSKQIVDIAASRPPLSSLDYQFIPLDIIVHWPRCSLMANSLAKNSAPFFENPKQQEAILSTILNELLENAVKFSSDKRAPASMSMKNYGDFVIIEISNSILPEQMEKFIHFLDSLHQAELVDAFIQIVENNFSQNPREGCQLGLLTLMKDYGVKIKIEPEEHDFLRPFLKTIQNQGNRVIVKAVYTPTNIIK